MTGPQLEDGYLRIANELFEAILRFGFSKRQLHVLLAILRKTYGFGKRADDMTVQQIANLTEIPRQHVSAALSELVAMNAVLKRDGAYGYVPGINKNYQQWQPSQNRTRPKTGRTPSQNRTVTVPKQDTQKTTPKDNNQKTLTRFDDFWAIYPKRRSRAQAEKAWTKIKPSEQLAGEIIAAVKRAKTSEDWQKEGGQFIPYPATWLNAHGWKDDICTSAEPKFRDVN